MGTLLKVDSAFYYCFALRLTIHLRRAAQMQESSFLFANALEACTGGRQIFVVSANLWKKKVESLWIGANWVSKLMLPLIYIHFDSIYRVVRDDTNMECSAIIFNRCKHCCQTRLLMSATSTQSRRKNEKHSKHISERLQMSFCLTRRQRMVN